MVRLLPKSLHPSGNRFPRIALPSGTCLLPFVATILCTSVSAFSQSTQWSVQIANTIISNHPADKSGTPSADAWDEETGRQLQGLEVLWYDSAKGDYFRYGKSIVDQYIDSANRIPQVSDSASLGRQLLLM
jgi:hypothetical protein